MNWMPLNYRHGMSRRQAYFLYLSPSGTLLVSAAQNQEIIAGGLAHLELDMALTASAATMLFISRAMALSKMSTIAQLPREEVAY